MIRLNQEQRFVFSLTRAALGYDSSELIASGISENLDWQKIKSVVVYNGLSSIVYDYLQTNSVLQARSDFVEQLRGEHWANIATSLLLEKALKEALEHFSKHGLTFAVHKGLALSALVYPKLNLRPAGTDLDIFIKRIDYAKAKSLLVSLGYGLEDARFERHEAKFIGEVHFVKLIGAQKVVVDLHEDFNPNHWGKVSRFDLGGFWDSLLQVQYNDFTIPHLPVEPSLFFLAIHCAANHIFDRFILLCDIDLLIRKFCGQIKWRKIGDYARRHRCRKTLYHSLSYCRRLFSTPIPEDFLSQIKPSRLSIALTPTETLILQDRKPSKRLERYMHILLLDNPLLFFRSLFIFAHRKVEAFFIQRLQSAPEREGVLSVRRTNDRLIMVSKVKAGNDLCESVKTAVDLIGGLDKFIAPSDKVLIKPNFNSPDPYPASSDLAFIRSVVKLLQSYGVKNICIGESCGLIWQPTANVLKKRGVPELARELGVRLINFDEADEWITIEINGKHFKRVSIAKAAIDADKIVYLPNLKTHSHARFTMSLKLTVGLMNPSKRPSLHEDHLEERIGDINLAVKPTLIILDGRKCFTTHGPEKGLVRRPGLVFASEDRVALDVEAVKILKSYWALNKLNLPVWELPQIASAKALKIGAESENDYQLVTADLHRASL
jgi:uncharacterized protein (DUF362 family)